MAAQHAGQPMQTVVEVRNVGKRYGIEGRKRDGSCLLYTSRCV